MMIRDNHETEERCRDCSSDEGHSVSSPDYGKLDPLTRSTAEMVAAIAGGLTLLLAALITWTWVALVLP